MKQRSTLDRESLEQFLAAVSLFQSLQSTAPRRTGTDNAPLPAYMLETLCAIDSGSLTLQPALQRVAELALRIVGGDRAAVWLFSPQAMICRAAAGAEFDDNPVQAGLRSKLLSADAFGLDPPPKLDLTRTFANYSVSVGPSLAIALLPGRGIAGALAVFSDPSRIFTDRNYANLRLLAGLAQYVVTKSFAVPEQASLDASPELNLAQAPLAMRTAGFPEEAEPPTIQPRSSIIREPGWGVSRGTSETIRLPQETTLPLRHKLWSDNPPHQNDSSLPHVPEQSVAEIPILSNTATVEAAPGPRPADAPQPSPTLQRWETWKQRFKSRRYNLFHAPEVNWFALRQAALAFTILAVMSFFVGLIAGARQAVTVIPLNSTAEAAIAPIPRIPDNPIPVPRKPTDTSHLTLTDRKTAATIAELSKYELRTLRRAAEYGDDQAAFELGMLHELGRSFPQSCSQAAYWVTKAALTGNAAAEYNLGLRYRDGDGVAVNIQEAERWFRKAAARKNSNANRALSALQESTTAGAP